MKNGFTAVLVACVALVAQAKIVAFKDADKIKSWDAWDDHKAKNSLTNILQKEKKCVTWAKLNRLDPGLKQIGTLAVRDSKDIAGSKWSIGCETMDRDYADWDSFKALLPGLGVKRARFFSGWAKTEQEKGKYDFTWLDPHLRECAAMGIKPWVCISYGNPVYGSDFRLGMRVKQVTDNPEGFAAWLKYTKLLVERYKDVVEEWEIWNEPFGQAQEYAEMFYRTAKVIREVQPKATILCTAIAMNPDMSKSDYAVVLERLKKENALDLASYFIYHPYAYNPDSDISDFCVKGQFDWQMGMPLRRLVKSYSGKFDIIQGEVGCPAQLEYAHALANVEWTEYSQAKWNLRRAIGDAVRAIPSNVFTMTDLKYTFMLQSFGLIRSNLLKEFVYRRPAYFAMRHVFNLLDDDAKPLDIETRPWNGRAVSRARFMRFGQTIEFFWFSDRMPSSDLKFESVDLEKLFGTKYKVDKWTCVAAWTDMITGRVFELPDTKAVPMWDSPIMIARRSAVPLAFDYRKLKPSEIVDRFYRPGQFNSGMKAFPGAHTNEAWMSMPTEKFLPCIDKYGQFKYREWPGKTYDDAQLKAAAAVEAEDLKANPGPEDRNQYGGWAKGPKLEATGRFRTHKDEKGRWWLVDPEGCLFWSFGPVRVSASSAMTPINGDNTTPRIGFKCPDRDCLFEDLSLKKFWTTHDDLLYPFFLARGETRIYDFSSANLFRKYGEDYYEKFSDICHRRIRSWGMNTIANSSDLKICLQDRTPYAERVEIKNSKVIEGSWGTWGKFRDPWDPSFKSATITALAEHGQEAHDKWCIGFFVDNEIEWGSQPWSLAQWTLMSPATQAAKAAAVGYFRGKYGEIAALNAAWKADYANWDDLLHSVKVPGAAAKDDLAAFTLVIVEEYFKRTREAVKEFDSKLLYLGCRFAGWCPPWVIGSCAKYCDVVSYNIYSRDISKWRLPQKLDAPVMVGEFHFGATDRGPFGTGVCVAKDQNDRAAAMKHYVESALDNPQMVGVHWHQFSDQATTGRFDGEYLQVGFTDICDTPYPIMRKAIREVGASMYNRRAGLSN